MALDTYFINSTDITVFPSTRRNSESRRMSESAITSIINRLIDNEDGFIITPRIVGKVVPMESGNLLEVSPDKPFEFNVYGYYFRLENLDIITGMMNETTTNEQHQVVPRYDKIYANILLESKDDVTKKFPYTELAGVDRFEDYAELSGQYDGLKLTGTDPIRKSSGEYQDFDPKHLLLFQKDSDGNWCVPDSSRVKFNWDSIAFKVDGGEIKN